VVVWVTVAHIEEHAHMTRTRIVLMAGAVAGVVGLSLGAAGVATAATSKPAAPTTKPAANANCPGMGGTSGSRAPTTSGSGV
jgi:hypothetical protein